jgi:hypothetical protein
VRRDLGWCTLSIGVSATLGGAYDGREITHRSAPEVIVRGYEGIIIGDHERPLPSRGHIRHAVVIAALKGASDGL